jgi:hypothetical protein
MAEATAVPGESHIGEVLTGRVASHHTLSPGARRLPPSIPNWPTAPAKNSRSVRVLVSLRVNYGVVAALALWLLLLVVPPRPHLTSIQDANELYFALLLFPLATAAAFGMCRFLVVRWACTLIAMWLLLSPMLLPGPFSNTALFGGLATFGAAAWAARED